MRKNNMFELWLVIGPYRYWGFWPRNQVNGWVKFEGTFGFGGYLKYTKVERD